MVIMGYMVLWEVKQECDCIYLLLEMMEDDGMKVVELEIQFVEMDGYMVESWVGEILIGVGID